MRTCKELHQSLGLTEIIKKPPAPKHTSHGNAYAETALANELAAIYGASNGTRNDQVNKSAYVLGQLVAGGGLDRATVEAALLSAGVSVGLSEPESRVTIRSGVEAGMLEPRNAPDSTYNTQVEEKPSQPKYGSLDRYCLNGRSAAMKAQMLADIFVLQDLALLGQSTNIYAAQNVGKTLITIWLIIEAIKTGKVKAEDIFYINADDTYKGLTIKTELAEQYGFNMLAPGHLGFKAEMVIEILAEMIETETASGKIFILDTVKKFTDLMDKAKSSKFGEAIRQFISNGGTVISLAHVNKHRGNDGKVIYSGTTDLVDDGDCAFTIDVVNHASDTKTVKFENFKARGDVAQEVTFSYDTGRGMTYLERLESIQRLDDEQVKQAKADSAKQATYERNIEAIRAIRDALQAGPCRKTDLVKTAAENSCISKPKIIQALHDHTGKKLSDNQFWTMAKETNNAAVYSLSEFL
jgi:hypothetical protein